MVLLFSAVLVIVTACTSAENPVPAPTSPAGLDADQSLILRTDFTDDGLWETVLADALAPLVVSTEGDEYVADLEPVDDRRYDGLTIEGLLDLFPSPPPYYVYVVDRITLGNPEHPILVVDMFGNNGSARGQFLRVIPREVASMEANLSIANVDFVDYVSSADPDGIFRGYD